MKTATFVSVACMLGVAAPLTLTAADTMQNLVHGEVTDKRGVPLKDIVLILETAVPPGREDSVPPRQWVRVGHRGTFDVSLPGEFTIIGVLPACYDVVSLRRTASTFGLVLSRLDTAGDASGAQRSGGSTTAFASAAAPSAASAAPSWADARGLVPVVGFMEAPATDTASAARILGGAATGRVSSSTGSPTPGGNSFRPFTASTSPSSLGTTPTVGFSNVQPALFGTQALSGISRTLGMRDPATGLGRTTWNSSMTYSIFPSPIANSNTLNSNVNTSLSRSWTTWSGATGTSLTWRPPKGIQATATPSCERWNQVEPR